MAISLVNPSNPSTFVPEPKILRDYSSTNPQPHAVANGRSTYSSISKPKQDEDIELQSLILGVQTSDLAKQLESLNGILAKQNKAIADGKYLSLSAGDLKIIAGLLNHADDSVWVAAIRVLSRLNPDQVAVLLHLTRGGGERVQAAKTAIFVFEQPQVENSKFDYISMGPHIYADVRDILSGVSRYSSAQLPYFYAGVAQPEYSQAIRDSAKKSKAIIPKIDQLLIPKFADDLENEDPHIRLASCLVLAYQSSVRLNVQPPKQWSKMVVKAIRPVLLGLLNEENYSLRQGSLLILLNIDPHQNFPDENESEKFYLKILEECANQIIKNFGEEFGPDKSMSDINSFLEASNDPTQGKLSDQDFELGMIFFNTYMMMQYQDPEEILQILRSVLENDNPILKIAMISIIGTPDNVNPGPYRPNWEHYDRTEMFALVKEKCGPQSGEKYLYVREMVAEMFK